MLKCEKCHERAATVFIKRVVDKQAAQTQLCEECAREEAISVAWLSGVPVPPNAAEMPLEELMMEIFNGAPDPDSFGPEDDKWSLQKLAAYDQLHTKGEFSADEDLVDDIDEMDDDDEENSIEMSPEEIQAVLDDMEPGDREAVSQMLEALDEVQEHLENIMIQHAQDIEDEAPGALDALSDDTLQNSGDITGDISDDTLASLQALFETDAAFAKSEEAAAEEPEESAAPEFKSAPSQRCPKCRTTWDRLREDGRAGCSSCYEAFEEMLGETIERQQQASQHVGKAPRSAAKRQRRLEMLRSRRDSRLAMLRERLQVALNTENFEEAAKLRDKIRVVESTIVEPGA